MRILKYTCFQVEILEKSRRLFVISILSSEGYLQFVLKEMTYTFLQCFVFVQKNVEKQSKMSTSRQ